jgi:hypothetical protein
MMNANPQAAAEQDRKAYRDVTAQLGLLGFDPAIPEGVRDLAEKTVAHTREACDRSMDAFDASVAAFETSFVAAGKGATMFNRKIIDIARRDVDSSFDLATSLAGAKRLYDMEVAGGQLAQASRCTNGPGRGGPRVVAEGDGRCR